MVLFKVIPSDLAVNSIQNWTCNFNFTFLNANNHIVYAYFVSFSLDISYSYVITLHVINRFCQVFKKPAIFVSHFYI